MSYALSYIIYMKTNETKYYYDTEWKYYVKIISKTSFWYSRHKGKWQAFVSNVDDIMKHHPFAIEVPAEQVFIDIL